MEEKLRTLEWRLAGKEAARKGLSNDLLTM